MVKQETDGVQDKIVDIFSEILTFWNEIRLSQLHSSSQILQVNNNNYG